MNSPFLRTEDIVASPAWQGLPPSYLQRLGEILLDAVFETETVGRYPDIEQMLLDCGHSLG